MLESDLMLLMHLKIVSCPIQPVMLINLHIVGPNVCHFCSVLGRHLMSIVKSEFEARPIEAKVVEAEP